MVKENLAVVEENIAAACRRVGRSRSDVTLIAVSKTKPVELIREAMDYGIRSFGENKVQEIQTKTELIKEPLDWHMIGHLQRNKVKYIIDKVKLIHSVDSLRLAEQISSEAVKRNLICDILIEVNIAEEESKFGVSKNDTEALIRSIAPLPGIRVKGLMTVAPIAKNQENNRKHFKDLYRLYIDIRSKNIDNVYMKELSMGMTGDYEAAIEEGATMVRVGTGVFGARNYNIES